MELVHVMEQKLSISEARARLPEIARHLEENPSEVVLVEHRDMKETLAITTQARLRFLETVATELRKRLRPPRPGWTLAGSITSKLNDDEMEAAWKEYKARQIEEDRKKIDRICSE